MKTVLLDLDTLTNDDIDFSELKEVGEIEFFKTMPNDKIIEAIGDADAVLINKANITRETIEKLPKLKYIGITATGYNNVDVIAAREHGIDVTNVPGYSTDSVVQIIMSYIFSFSTNLFSYNESVHRGDWIKSPTFTYFTYPFSELANKTIGVIGYGAIGSKVCKIANAIGMDVAVYTKSAHPECKFRRVTKEEVFSQSDYLVLCCPYNEGTKNIVCKETLSLMKKSAFLVNTSRGGCVDSSALCEALNQGLLAGAGIDVLKSEPMDKNEELFSAKNCIITPHIAWTSIEARRRLIKIATDNLVKWKNGKAQNVVNL